MRPRAVPPVVYRVGFWSAVLTTLWIIAFTLTVTLIPTQVLTVGTSLLLAPAFLVLIVSIHNYAREDKRIWSQIALSFAIAYLVVAGVNYFVQLTVVRQNPQAYNQLTMNFTPDSAFWSLEVLGYTLMSMAALFTIPVFAGGKIEQGIKALFLFNALVTLAAAIAYILTANPLHVLVLASLGVWSIAFPVATILVAVLFRRAERMIE